MTGVSVDTSLGVAENALPSRSTTAAYEVPSAAGAAGGGGGGAQPGRAAGAPAGAPAGGIAGQARAGSMSPRRSAA